MRFNPASQPASHGGRGGRGKSPARKPKSLFGKVITLLNCAIRSGESIIILYLIDICKSLVWCGRSVAADGGADGLNCARVPPKPRNYANTREKRSGCLHIGLLPPSLLGGSFCYGSM